MVQGPLSASVAASDWGLYFGGVFDGCDYDRNIVVNHAVLLVGYGTDPQGGDYWLIKVLFHESVQYESCVFFIPFLFSDVVVQNSWSSSWGDDGYIKLKREAEPRCGTDSSPLDGSACEIHVVEDDFPNKLLGAAQLCIRPRPENC